jgi:hypothetical protein
MTGILLFSSSYWTIKFREFGCASIERSIMALFFSSSILFLKYTSDEEFLALPSY